MGREMDAEFGLCERWRGCWVGEKVVPLQRIVWVGRSGPEDEVVREKMTVWVGEQERGSVETAVEQVHEAVAVACDWDHGVVGAPLPVDDEREVWLRAASDRCSVLFQRAGVAWWR